MTSATLPLMKQALPRTGLVLVAAGLFLIAWVGWTLLQPERGPLHHYQLTREGALADFEELEVSSHGDLAVQRFAVQVESVERPVAFAYVTPSTQGPVLMQWDNELAEPFLYQQGSLAELVDVAAAIDEHAAEDTQVLGWWDELRRLRVLSETVREAPGHRHESPLLPTTWRDERPYALPVEKDFWSPVLADVAVESRYQSYLAVLLEKEEAAAGSLRSIAQGSELLLVVNAADAFKLGMARPDQYGIGYKDFADTGNLHGTIERVKTWLEEQKFRQYLVQRLSDQRVRAYYLTDETSQHSLISALVPFSGRGPIHLKHFDLVYQRGSYWVYSLKAENSPGVSAQD